MTSKRGQTGPVEGVFRYLIDGYLKVLDSDIHFAFHPVVSDTEEGVTGFEALVRHAGAVTAESVNSAVSPENRFAFDQACRILAIEAAARFGIEGNLHLNCTHVTAKNAELVCTVTRKVAEREGFPCDRLVLEFSNLDALETPEELQAVHRMVKAFGFQILFDNFGSGERDTERLDTLRPDWLKFDRGLITGIHENESAQSRIRNYLAHCREMHIQPMAAGIESAEELAWLRAEGVTNFQGYYFTPPEMEQQQVYRTG